MKRTIYKDKQYTHFDAKKSHENFAEKVENVNWVKKHGFYPFIHFSLNFDKYTSNPDGTKYLKTKERDIYYAAHIDRYIYEYYGNRLNTKYNIYLKQNGINKVPTAYRNSTPGKCNIDFAREVFEFIKTCKNAYIFVGDFSKFFDRLDHCYLKNKIKQVLGTKFLDEADYAIFKNITHFSYIEADDIEKEKGKLRRDMRELPKYFETGEFREVKKKHLQVNRKTYQIPQGASISAVYANVYMVDFDKKINDFITSKRGMYRRYCDDIIMVVPMVREEIDLEKNREIDDFVYKIRDEIPNLELNKDKTEHFFYENGEIKEIKGDGTWVNYLGFTFDGSSVRIRDKSLFKFYCRAYRKIKKVKESKDDDKAFNAGKKAVYRSYTHLGVSKNPREYGNFLTYAYKADRIFNESKLLNSEIRSQVKRHWNKIDKALKEVDGMATNQ